MSVYISDREPASIRSRLDALVSKNRPGAIGMATAFLSLGGAQIYDLLVSKVGAPKSRVVAGLSGAITQPSAIDFLLTNGHDVRLGVHANGVFHPKLLIGGDRFLRSGLLGIPTCAYVGSANFTSAGLTRNLEIILATEDPALTKDIADAFRGIWIGARRATRESLENYQRAFARAQRRRSITDLEFLNVADSESFLPRGISGPLVPAPLCNSVWVGLQSFTGEHTFQVEFPRMAGEALEALLGTRSGEVMIECSDGYVRKMTFRYYEDNGMYRLNVPNNMPLVEWARSTKSGALLVWRDDESGTQPLHTEIIRGRRLAEVVARSKALRTLGRTTTRQYGWY